MPKAVSLVIIAVVIAATLTVALVLVRQNAAAQDANDREMCAAMVADQLGHQPLEETLDIVCG